MKSWFRTILCVAVLCTLCGISVSADRPSNSYPDGFTEEQRQEYERVIVEANVMHHVDRFYEQTAKTLGEFSYRVPEDEYVLLYHLFEITEEMLREPEKILTYVSAGQPNIFIPIYRTSDPEERIIGHVDLHYNAGRKAYIASPCFLGDAGKAGSEPGHYLETVGTFAKAKSICEKAGIEDITDAVLVQIGAAYNDFVDIVLIVRNAGGLFVYDFMNTAHVDEAEPAVYTLEEFAELRKAFEEVEFGGQTLKEQSKKGLDDLRFLIAVIALLAAVIAVGGRILYRHLRRRKTSAGNV